MFKAEFSNKNNQMIFVKHVIWASRHMRVQYIVSAFLIQALQQWIQDVSRVNRAAILQRNHLADAQITQTVRCQEWFLSLQEITSRTTNAMVRILNHHS